MISWLALIEFLGCGMFGGDKQLKSLIQVIASSQAERGLHYIAFGDVDFYQKFSQLCTLFKSKNVTVGELFNCVVSFKEFLEQNPKEYQTTLYEYVSKTLRNL